jgi:ABC-type multidrug transport system ATPase subunit
VTTQNIEEAEYLADRICIIKNGVVLKEGKPREIKDEFCYNFKITLSVPLYLSHSMKKTFVSIGDEEIDSFEAVRIMAK